MGTPAWDHEPEHPAHHALNPQLTIHCTYPNTSLAPTYVTFGVSPEYGIHGAREAHDWFLRMMAEHEEFEVETVEAQLVLDDDNPYDPKAVRIDIRGETVGHLSRELARDYRDGNVNETSGTRTIPKTGEYSRPCIIRAE